MCTMSVVMDYGIKQFGGLVVPSVSVPFSPPITTIVIPPTPPIPPTDAIKAFEELLRKAKEYDRITGQPDCELDSKKKALKAIADQLGVTIEFP